MFSEIFNVISVFPGDAFSTWKIETKCAAAAIHAARIL